MRACARERQTKTPKTTTRNSNIEEQKAKTTRRYLEKQTKRDTPGIGKVDIISVGAILKVTDEEKT